MFINLQNLICKIYFNHQFFRIISIKYFVISNLINLCLNFYANINTLNFEFFVKFYLNLKDFYYFDLNLILIVSFNYVI